MFIKKRYRFRRLEWVLDTMNLSRYTEKITDKECAAATKQPPYLSDGEKSTKNIRLRWTWGKVTDAGYDRLRVLYTAVPADNDFTVTAHLRVRTFLQGGTADGQEGFGVFVRDTLRPDPETGQFYSNMAAVGGYGGCFNFFGRDGLTADSFEQVRNFCLNKTEEGKAPASTDGHGPFDVTLTLKKKGLVVSARMTDKNGRDLLADQNGQRKPAGIPIEKKGTMYAADLMPAAFEQRDADSQYIGFFAARGADIEIDTKSVRVTVGKGRKPASAASAGKPGLADPAAKPASKMTPGRDGNVRGSVLYAAPGALNNAAGTKDHPYDLMTALKVCHAGGEIRLLPGCYKLQQSIVLGETPTEMAGGDARGLFYIEGVSSQCARLCLDPECLRQPKPDSPGGKTGAVLDFQGTRHCLMISGENREADGLSVTGGYGIWITGNHNRVTRCRAFKNRETGVLIRALRNDIPSDRWPCDNLIEECVSHENCDPSGRNADGFACKVAAGDGNRFTRCRAFLNTDDGFDLFAKNRRIGAVTLEECESFLNGWLPDETGQLAPSRGNGNGFKLGGSGLTVRHQAISCTAEGNRGDGFTSNSNPVMIMRGCSAANNGGENIEYYFTGPEAVPEKIIENCSQRSDEAFSAQEYYGERFQDNFL